MKTKRFTAALLSAVFMAGNIPVYTYAAEVNKTLDVENVATHISFWGGTHYITYTLNGVEYDSRTAGTKINTGAFRAMDKDAKKKVYSHYYPGKDRTEQFGEAGVQEICDYVNDVQGNTHAWKVMHDRAQYYCKDLMPYYGGVSAEDDPNRYYDQEYNRLNTFTGDVQKLINSYYMNEPEAQAFREKYGMMNNLMQTGKQAYDNCVNHNEFARNAAVKATSAWLIKFIVENTIVPGLMAKPSATAAGVDSAMNTVYDQVLGMISEITGSENVSVTTEGNLVNLTIGKMGGQNISLKKGAEIVKYMRELADKNYKLAKYTHEKAVEFHDQLESEAAEVIRKIEEREKKQEEAQKKEEQKKAENDKKADTSQVKPNTERYSGIKEPSGSDEDYNKKQEEYKNKLIQAAKALDEEVESLYSQMLSDAVVSANNAGYYVKSSSSDSVSGDYVQFEGNNNCLSGIKTEGNAATYNPINSEEEYKNRPKLYDEDIEIKNNAVLKINTLESSLNSVTDRFSVLYKELYARRKALNEKGAYNYYTIQGNNWLTVEFLFSRINQVILEQTYIRVNLENGFEQYEKKHKYNMESYENYKAQMQEKLDNYLTAQTNFGLACAMYSDIAGKQRELAQNGLPDYVYTQKFQPYGNGLPLADGSNTALENKINAASDKHKFFKDEAKKLEECMEKN
ncbi:MAG: hypothetical protein IJR45_02610, partial [Firmicutes bacterium]|nr:hypothetical protein [Bacillota bacterium]